MKTLTTLTAVAALIAGISIASAQTSTAPKSGGAMGPSAGGGPAKAEGTGKFCSTGSAGAKDCTFATLQACQAAAKSGESCAPNPKSATTGSQN